MDFFSNLNSIDLTKKNYIYARCSTSKQNSYNHYSLETQIYNCNQFLQEKHFTLENTVTEVTRANNIKNQIQLLKLLEDNSNINIFIFDTSRFSRNISQGIELFNKCKHKNITIYVVKDNYSTENIIGNSKFINDIIKAADESKLIRERILATHKYLKSKGAHFGRPPYGYKIERIENINKFVVNEEENKIIAIARDLYYGCPVQNLNEKILLLTGKNIISLFDEPCEIIEYGNFTFPMIAEFLNTHSIYNRTKLWTASSCRTIITTNPIINNKRPREPENDTIELNC
jgi:DNA invertase Pin-like site-specific DNA recombinase